MQAFARTFAIANMELKTHFKFSRRNIFFIQVKRAAPYIINFLEINRAKYSLPSRWRKAHNTFLHSTLASWLGTLEGKVSLENTNKWIRLIVLKKYINILAEIVLLNYFQAIMRRIHCSQW